MTPNGMLQALQDAGVSASFWQMGGNCGVIGVVLPDCGYATITPESGPWSFGEFEAEDMGDRWGLYRYADADTEEWTDAAGVLFGDTMVTPGMIVEALA
jgi:hypothetical protein